MANFYILSNNPRVREKYPVLTHYIEASVEGIFIAGRDAIHQGAVLINHPLAGSIKPNESPYKSLVLSEKRKQLDLPCLQLIEDAVAVLKKLPVKKRVYSEAVLEDFAAIDLDLLDSAMMALPAAYHL